MSRVLEALFDEIEFRLAKRAFRLAAKRKAKRRYPKNMVTNHSRATASRSISVKAA